jgi:hypothetical protein
MSNKPTLEALKSEVVRAGFTLSAGAWEDEHAIYAASAEAVPGCYGHPKFEATFCKRTGWLRLGKRPAIKFTEA